MDYSKYTKHQQSIINGNFPIEGTFNLELDRILVKARFYVDAPVMEFIRNEFITRGRHTIKVTGRQRPYSKQQQEVLDGKKDIRELSDKALETFHNSACNAYDPGTAAMVEEEMKRRGPWIKTIDGYSDMQTSLILGINDIQEVSDRTVMALLAASRRNCDEDVKAFANEELRRRNIRKQPYPKSIIGVFNDIKAEPDKIGKYYDPYQCQAYYYAFARHDVEVIKTLAAAITSRNQEGYARYYTEAEWSVIRGKVPFETIRLWYLKDFYRKLLHDNRLKDSEITAVVAEAIRLKDEERANLLAHRDDYNEEQRLIIMGDIPIWKVSKDNLLILARRAERHEDTDIAEYVREELKAREKLVDHDKSFTEREQRIIGSAKAAGITGTEVTTMPETKKITNLRPPTIYEMISGFKDEEYEKDLYEHKITRVYTERQRKIMDGTVDLDTVNGREISKVIKKARKYKAYERADELEKYLQNRLGSGYHAKTPEKPESSDRTKDIARGVIPYEEVSLSELRTIASKARKAGDIELLELMQTMILDKEREVDYKEPNPNNGYFINRTNKSEEWAKDILEGRESASDCTMKDLLALRLYASEYLDKEHVELAKRLIEIRKDESVLYPAQTKKEAMAMIEEHLAWSVKWPEDWYEEE